jgi:hypothetical protein
MANLKPPYPIIFRGLTECRVIPFIGSGASLGQIADGVAWDRDTASRLPTAGELTDYLATQAVFPEAEQRDLAKVAQYYDAVAAGRIALHRDLHEIFACDYPLADIHVFLAEIEAPLLIVTTNYDNLIECAFRDRGKPFDVVVHTTHSEHADSVLWWPHEQEPQYVPPNEFVDIDLDTTTVIYKMHGSVDQQDEFRDSFVITEDDYIEFLTRVATRTAIPAIFAEPFQARHFLFLGYGLRDWNLRVVLNKLERDWPRRRGIRSWAIQLRPSALERQFWQQRGVEIYDMTIQEFVRNLRERGR